MAKIELEKKGNDLLTLVIVEGILAVLFGIVALFWPGLTLALLVLYFAVFILSWGVVSLIRSIINVGKVKLWWLELVASIVLVGLGVYLLRNPGLTFGFFILLAGLSFLVRGAADLMKGLLGEHETVRDTRIIHIIGGALGLVAGAITLMQPVSSGVAIVWILGLYAVLEGSLIIALAVKERALLEELNV